MKKFLVLGIFVFFINIFYAQRIEEKNIYSTVDFVTIKVQDGFTKFGTQSLSLQPEGFVYWNRFIEGSEEKAKIIPLTDLDGDKLWSIMQYVYENSMYDIKELEVSENMVKPTTMPIVLSFIFHDQLLYTKFNYEVCDEKIDTLIRMMNELIPEDDREEFEIKLKCN